MTAERNLRAVPTALDGGPGAIAREIRIAAPPEVVFAYFTDPTRHVRWQGIAAELEPRPGGTFRVTFAAGYVARGTYLEVIPPRRLVYSWGWEAEGSSVLPPGVSTVEVTLEAADAGTILRVRHTGLPDATVEFHELGWDESLTELGRAVTPG